MLHPSWSGDEVKTAIARDNSDTAGNWKLYNSHRSHVTSIVEELGASGHGAVVVLGAGNCNDIDLAQLSQRYRIHLVDFDLRALRRARERFPNVHALHIVDLRTPNAVVDWSKSHAWPSGDLVVSSNVLTQLMWSAEMTGMAVAEAKRQHLDWVLSCTREDGSCVVFVDLVSSDTMTELQDIEANPQDLLQKAVATENHFVGLNPKTLIDDLRHSSHYSRISGIGVSQPWIWNHSESRSYLCFALAVELRLSKGED